MSASLNNCTSAALEVNESRAFSMRSSASFNLKVIQEESRTSGVSSINLKRLRSVERQLMPGGINEIHDMLETAGLTRPDAITALLDAVQAVARDQRPSLEGLYKCTQRNGVGDDG